MKRRVFSLLLAMTMVMSLLPVTAEAASPESYSICLYQGEIRKNHEGGSVITVEGITAANVGGVWTYTFNNVDFTSTTGTALQIADENAAIVLADGSINTLDSGDASDSDASAIYAYGTLTIRGGGTLRVHAGTATSGQYTESYGIYAADALVINGVTIQVEANGTTRFGYGLNSDSISISNTTLEVEATGATESYALFGGTDSDCISITNSQVTLQASTCVSAYYYGNDYVPTPIAPRTTNMKVTAGADISGDDAQLLTGWQGNGSDNVSGYKYMRLVPSNYVEDTTPPVLTEVSVERTASSSAVVKYSSNEPGDLFFTHVAQGSSAPADPTSWPGSCVSGVNTLTLSDLPDIGVRDVYIMAKDNSRNKSDWLKVAIPAYTATDLDYKVVLSGGKVYKNTAESSNEISGSALGITGVGSTYTFSGVDIKTATAIEVLDSSATIQLVGENTVKGSDSYGADAHGIKAAGTLRFTGDGALSVTSGTAHSSDGYTNRFSYGVYAQSGLTVESGSIIATAAISTGYGYGCHVAEGELTVSGGSLNASAVNTSDDLLQVTYGIYLIDDMKVTGGTVTASGGSDSAASYGVWVDEYKNSSAALYISGGTVTISGEEAATNKAPVLTNMAAQAGANAASAQPIGDLSDISSYRYLVFEPDTEPPVLTLEKVERVSETEAKITVSASESGCYYSALLVSDGSSPQLPQTNQIIYPFNEGQHTFHVSLDPNAGAAYGDRFEFFVMAKDHAGNLAGWNQFSIPAYVPNFTIVLNGGTVKKQTAGGDAVVTSIPGISGKDDGDGSFTYTFDGVDFETAADVAVEILDSTADIVLADNAVNTLWGGQYAISFNGTLTISGYELHLSGGTAAINKAPRTATGMMVSAGDKADGTGSGSLANWAGDGSDIVSGYRYLRLDRAYTLKLSGGRQYKNMATESEVHIPGISAQANPDGSYTYTFEDVTFISPDADAVSISTDQNTPDTIVLKGVSVIRGGDDSEDYGATGLYVSGSLNITGDGSLEVTAGDSAGDMSCALYINGALIVSGGNITATAGSGPEGSYGVYLNQPDYDMTVSNAAFTAYGKTRAIAGDDKEKENIVSRAPKAAGATVLAGASAGAAQPLADWKGDGTDDTSAYQYVYLSTKHKYVAFDLGDSAGSMPAVLVEEGERYTLPGCSFTSSTGYPFKGWALTENGEVITDDSITVNANITLYAIWSDEADFTLYLANGKVHAGNGGPQLTDMGITYENGVYVFDGVDFATTHYEALRITDTSATIQLAEGSVNTLLGGTGYDSNGAVQRAYGLYATGDLTITGKGTLHTTGGNTEGKGSAKTSAGIHASGNLRIEGGKIYAFASTVEYGNSEAISVGKDIIITGGTIEARGGKSSGWASYGIYASYNITISGGTVTAVGGPSDSGSYGISTGREDVTVRGGTVTAIGGSSGSSSVGISLGFQIRDGEYEHCGTFTLTGGNVTATGGTGSQSYGVAAQMVGHVVVTGGTLYASGDHGANNGCGIHGRVGSSLTITGGTVTVTGSTRAIQYDWGYTYLVPVTLKDGEQMVRVIAGTEITGVGAATLETWKGDGSDGIYDYKYMKLIAGKNTIRFDPGDGSGTMEPRTVLNGSQYTLPACTFTAPSRMQFAGWATDPESNIIPAAEIAVTEDLILYAIWEEIKPDGAQTLLDVSKGYISIGDGTVDGYAPDGTHITTYDPDGYIITGRFVAKSSGEEYRAVIESGSHKITLRDVTMDFRAKNYAAGMVVGGTVEITLEGENILWGGIQRAGLNVYENGQVTITAQSTGSLNVGSKTDNTYAAAAFGANYNGMNGTLIIQGGKINATAGGSGADAIGAGKNGTRGPITITSGYFATGDVDAKTVCGVAVADGYKVVESGNADYPYKVVTVIEYTLVLSGGKVYQNQVDGQELTNTGITGSGSATEGYTYTFDGVEFATYGNEALHVEDDKAVIYLPEGSHSRLSVDSAATGGSYAARGINAKDLTIAGPGTLIVQVNGPKTSCYGVHATGKLTIRKSTVTAEAGEGYYWSVGLRASGGMEISDAVVTASSAGGSGNPTAGIYVTKEDLVITNSKVTATGGKQKATYSCSYGIYSGKDLLVSDSTVVAASGSCYYSGSAAYGISCEGDGEKIVFSNSEVTMTANGTVSARYAVNVAPKMPCARLEATIRGGASGEQAWTGDGTDVVSNYSSMKLTPVCEVTVTAADAESVTAAVKSSGTAILMVARYDNGRMTMIKMVEVSAGASPYVVGLGGSGSTVRAFLLDSNYAPLCAAAER